jgi:hypothetical protein
MVYYDEVHIRVSVVGLTPGDPAFVTVSRSARRPDGKERTFVQKLQTTADLFARLVSEVKEGEEIEATIVTQWRKAGYTTRLCDFVAVTASSSESVCAA